MVFRRQGESRAPTFDITSARHQTVSLLRYVTNRRLAAAPFGLATVYFTGTLIYWIIGLATWTTTIATLMVISFAGLPVAIYWTEYRRRQVEEGHRPSPTPWHQTALANSLASAAIAVVLWNGPEAIRTALLVEAGIQFLAFPFLMHWYYRRTGKDHGGRLQIAIFATFIVTLASVSVVMFTSRPDPCPEVASTHTVVEAEASKGNVLGQLADRGATVTGGNRDDVLAGISCLNRGVTSSNLQTGDEVKLPYDAEPGGKTKGNPWIGAGIMLAALLLGIAFLRSKSRKK
jgi:hypothetical protein